MGEDLRAKTVAAAELIAHTDLVVATEVVVKAELVELPEGDTSPEFHLAVKLYESLCKRACRQRA